MPAKKNNITGHWTPQEDEDVRHLFSVFGERWHDISQAMKTRRTHKQVRDRQVSSLLLLQVPLFLKLVIMYANQVFVYSIPLLSFPSSPLTLVHSYRWVNHLSPNSE